MTKAEQCTVHIDKCVDHVGNVMNDIVFVVNRRYDLMVIPFDVPTGTQWHGSHRTGQGLVI